MFLAAFFSFFFWLAAKRAKNFTDKAPTGLLSFVELVVEKIDEVVRDFNSRSKLNEKSDKSTCKL